MAESTHTIMSGRKYINLPTKFAGRNLTRGDAEYLYKQGTLKPVSTHDTAEEAAKTSGTEAPKAEEQKKKKNPVSKVYDMLGGNVGD